LEEYNVKLPIMKKLVKDSIKVYNTKKPHLSCQMKTTEQMHKQKSVKIQTYKKSNRLKVNLQSV